MEKHLKKLSWSIIITNGCSRDPPPPVFWGRGKPLGAKSRFQASSPGGTTGGSSKGCKANLGHWRFGKAQVDAFFGEKSEILRRKQILSDKFFFVRIPQIEEELFAVRMGFGNLIKFET